MNILLIAGHGDGDSGATAYNRREDVLAREVVSNVKAALSIYECNVEVFDTAKSAYHELVTLGKSYDFTRFDYVLEVHFNAFRENSDGNITGSEIYVTRAEASVAVEESILKRLATLGFKNRGVKRMNFSVILKAKNQGVSSALLEVCFIDDLDDITLYESRKIQVAQAIAGGIAEGFRLKKRGEDMAFSDIENHWARAEIERLSDLGIVDGYADGTFRPDEKLSRAEAAKMLTRLYDALNVN